MRNRSDCMRWARSIVVVVVCLGAGREANAGVRVLYEMEGSGRPSGCTLSSSGAFLAAYDFKEGGLSIAVYDVQKGTAAGRCYPPKPMNHAFISISKDGRIITANDKIGNVWHRTKDDSAKETSHAFTIADTTQLLVCNDGSRVAMADDAGIVLCNANGGERRRVWTSDNCYVHDLKCSDDGRRLAILSEKTAESTSEVLVIDVETREVVFSTPMPVPYVRGRIALSGDGRTLVVGGVRDAMTGGFASQDFFVWDCNDKKLIHNINVLGNNSHQQGVLSRDGKQLVVSGLARNGKWLIRIYDTVSGRITNELNDGDFVDSATKPWYPVAAFSETGDQLIFASPDGTVRSWSFRPEQK